MIVPIFLLIYPYEFTSRRVWLARICAGLAARKAPTAFSPPTIWVVFGRSGIYPSSLSKAPPGCDPMYQYFLQTIVLSIFYTWFHNNTGGSVLVAIIFHAVANTAAAAVPFWTTELGRWINFGLLVIAAVVILFIWGGKGVCRSKK